MSFFASYLGNRRQKVVVEIRETVNRRLGGTDKKLTITLSNPNSTGSQMTNVLKQQATLKLLQNCENQHPLDKQQNKVENRSYPVQHTRAQIQEREGSVSTAEKRAIDERSAENGRTQSPPGNRKDCN